jgi:small subunit ribosomal protein S20
MPITSSAKKALRASERKHVFNMRRKLAIDKNMKSFKKAISTKDKSSALALIPQIYKSLDKAAKKGVIHKNTASRKKSRLAKAIAKLAK